MQRSVGTCFVIVFTLSVFFSGCASIKDLKMYNVIPELPCGVSRITNPHVYNGESALLEEFPWQTICL